MHGEQTERRKRIWHKLTNELNKRKLAASTHPLRFELSDQQIREIVGSSDKSNPLPIDFSYDPLNSIRARAGDASFRVEYKSDAERGIKVFTEITE